MRRTLWASNLVLYRLITPGVLNSGIYDSDYAMSSINLILILKKYHSSRNGMVSSSAGGGGYRNYGGFMGQTAYVVVNANMNDNCAPL